MSKVRLCRRVYDELVEVHRRIAEDNVGAADKQLAQIHDAFSLLADHPQAGESHPELNPAIRLFPRGSYVIFYQETANGIEVLAVVHGARDLGSIAKEL